MATKEDGTIVSPEDIKDDVSREYLDKTVAMEMFPFMEVGVIMQTVNPCNHAS